MTHPNQNRSHTTHIATLLLAALLAALALTACGSDSPADRDHSASAGHGEHYSAPPGLTQGQPDTALTSVLTTVFSWEPVTDESPTDALQRAIPNLTGQALASAQQPDRKVRVSAEWNQWRTSGDLITARVENIQITSINPTRAVARATVIQTVLHLDGGSTPYRTLTAQTELTVTDGQWKVSTYPTTTSQ